MVILKSNLDYADVITSKRVTSGEAHLRGLARGCVSPKKRRAVGDVVPSLTVLGMEPQIYRTDVYDHYATNHIMISQKLYESNCCD